MSGAGSRASPSSGSRTPPYVRPGSGSARRCSTRDSSSRRAASRPTWRPPTCASRDLASTSRSRLGCSWPVARSRRLPLAGYAFCGELSLGGAIRPVHGAIAVAAGARAAGHRRLVVAEGNGAEAALIEGVQVLPVPDLSRMAAMLRGEWEPDPPAPAEARPASRRPRPRRRPRAGGRPASARDRGGWRAQPPHGRVRREQGRRCWPGGCRGSCLRPTSTRRSRSPGSARWPGWAMAASPPSGPFVRPTTRSPPLG